MGKRSRKVKELKKKKVSIREVKEKLDESSVEEKVKDKKVVKPGLGPVEFVESHSSKLKEIGPVRSEAKVETPRVEQSSVDVRKKYVSDRSYSAAVVASSRGAVKTEERVYRQTMAEVDSQLRAVRQAQEARFSENLRAPAQVISLQDGQNRLAIQRRHSILASDSEDLFGANNNNLERKYEARETVYREHRRE